MNLYPYIFKRKSTRKYKMNNISSEIIDTIQDYIKEIVPLYPDIKVEFQLTGHENIKNLLPIKAPYYFIISSEKKDNYLENVGFMGQQLDLFLSSKNLGSCWLGLAKTKNNFKTKLEFVITLAFGEAEISPYRDITEFKRKKTNDIADFEDIRLLPVSLSPSATNSQNWYFHKTELGVSLYRKKLNIVESLAYDKMNAVDMGIALCHFYLASQENSIPFAISKISNPEILDKLIYVCTII